MLDCGDFVTPQSPLITNKEKDMSKSLTDIDNALDYLTIYDQLGSAQHSLLHSIVRIFNNQSTRFPESLIIANISLQTKAGIKPGSFHRTRQALIDFRIDQSDENSWIIRYQENQRQFAGRYWINYDILQINTNDTTTDQQPNNNIHTNLPQPNNKPLSKKPKNDNDLRENRSDQKEEIRKENISSADANDFENDNPIESDPDIYINQNEEGISTQVSIVKKAIAVKYKLMPSDYNKPSYQFIKELLELHADKGGAAYVLRKVSELPVPCETNTIGNTLRSWCERPEMGNDKSIKSEQKEPHYEYQPTIEELQKFYEEYK